MIRTRFAKLERTSDGVITHFDDGTSWGARPHHEPHYHYLAYRYGHDGDVVAYCQTHELCHHLLSEGLGRHSLVLWALAHGDRPTTMVAAAEEALAMTLHRYVMLNEPPLIEGIDWDALKQRYFELMES